MERRFLGAAPLALNYCPFTYAHNFLERLDQWPLMKGLQPKILSYLLIATPFLFKSPRLVHHHKLSIGRRCIVNWIFLDAIDLFGGILLGWILVISSCEDQLLKPFM